MRKRRILIFSCFAAVVVITVNELPNFLERKLKISNYTMRERIELYQEKQRERNDGASKGTLARLKNTSDSVIPDIFYERLGNITPHDFRYKINPAEYCAKVKYALKENLNLLVLIASAPWEFERREIIRRTWAAKDSIFGQRIGFLFFVGNDKKEKTYISLRHESRKYGDIVMEDYIESYRNLSLKTQGQLKWVVKYCPNVKLLLHVDDDVVPDISGILQDVVRKQLSSRREIGCAKVFMPRVRREGKWKTSIEEYPGEQYPLSCVGWCFILPLTIARDLYDASLKTRLLHLEDVWMTGILREKIGGTKIRKLQGGEKLCKHLGWPKDRPTNEKIFEAWEVIKSNRG